jgi:hypothetical protein
MILENATTLIIRLILLSVIEVFLFDARIHFSKTCG